MRVVNVSPCVKRPCLLGKAQHFKQGHEMSERSASTSLLSRSSGKQFSVVQVWVTGLSHLRCPRCWFMTRGSDESEQLGAWDSEPGQRRRRRWQNRSGDKVTINPSSQSSAAWPGAGSYSDTYSTVQSCEKVAACPLPDFICIICYTDMFQIIN